MKKRFMVCETFMHKRIEAKIVKIFGYFSVFCV